MKFFITLIGLFFAGIGAAQAQTLIPDVTNNYSLSVIAKVQDVVLAANIAQSEQVPVANFFQTEATSIATAVSNNATPQQLQVVQVQLIAQFQSILSPQELAQFTANRPNSVYATPPAAQATHNQ